jgi:hypothetical protein
VFSLPAYSTAAPATESKNLSAPEGCIKFQIGARTVPVRSGHEGEKARQDPTPKPISTRSEPGRLVVWGAILRFLLSATRAMLCGCGVGKPAASSCETLTRPSNSI